MSKNSNNNGSNSNTTIQILFKTPSAKTSNLVFLLALIGLSISIYAVYIENASSLDNAYHASCDINEVISCSKALLSQQAHIFRYLGIIPKDSLLDFPNAVYGIVFYVFVLIISRFMDKLVILMDILLFVSTCSMTLSAYLAYILVQMSTICVVCLTTHACNSAIFFVCISCLSLYGHSESGLDRHVKVEVMKSKSKSKNKRN